MDATPLTGRLSAYAAYHRHPWNRALHWVGIPAIVLGILQAAAWVELGAGFTLAGVVALAYLGWVATLELRLAILLAIDLAFGVWLARELAPLGWPVFLALFGGGWALQLIGHGIEGRRPALADNLGQVLSAPLFLMAEGLVWLGARADLREALRGDGASGRG